MAKKNTFANEFGGKDAKELQGLLAECRSSLHELLFRHSIGQLKNVRELTQIRKRIAHITTALSAQR